MHYFLPYNLKMPRDTVKSYYRRTSNQQKLEQRLKDWYYNRTEQIFGHGRYLNLEHPVTFSEKLQWLKIYDHSKERTKLSDKYLAKKLVAKRIGPEYVLPVYGVWKKFSDINFAALPNQFALKTNHGNTWHLLVRDKSKLDYETAKAHFDEWMSVNFFKAGLEMQYRDIKRRIFAEQLLQNSDANKLYDYCFWCFHGEPVFITVTHKEDHRAVLTSSRFDLDFNHIWPPVSRHIPELDPLPPKPASLELMKDLSRTLSKEFPFVRVDFYELNGHPYFGEMTFTPAKGVIRWADPECDQIYGRMLKLPMDR